MPKVDTPAKPCATWPERHCGPGWGAAQCHWDVWGTPWVGLGWYAPEEVPELRWVVEQVGGHVKMGEAGRRVWMPGAAAEVVYYPVYVTLGAAS